MTFTEAMETVAQVFEAIGAIVLLGGLLLSLGLAGRVLRRSGEDALAYRVLRQSFGGVILLGLGGRDRRCRPVAARRHERSRAHQPGRRDSR